MLYVSLFHFFYDINSSFWNSSTYHYTNSIRYLTNKITFNFDDSRLIYTNLEGETIKSHSENLHPSRCEEIQCPDLSGMMRNKDPLGKVECDMCTFIVAGHGRHGFLGNGYTLQSLLGSGDAFLVHPPLSLYPYNVLLHLRGSPQFFLLAPRIAHQLP